MPYNIILTETELEFVLETINDEIKAAKRPVPGFKKDPIMEDFTKERINILKGIQDKLEKAEEIE
jgi:hypothetical protein